MNGAYGGVAMLFLAALAALYPAPMAWVHVVAFMLFEFWLLRRMKREGDAPAMAGEAPYYFTEEEAVLIGRFRFYFTFPEVARNAASTLAAIGISALILAPWLLFRGAFIPAMLVAVNLLAVGVLTRRLSPVLVLRIAANKGDRTALRMLELHDPLWEKIKGANPGG
jgi:putative Ca2+/H+ antiporter (TMEM165/GDT1 family)